MFGRHIDLLIYLLLLFYFQSFKTNTKQLLSTVHVSLFIGIIFLLTIKNPWYHFAPIEEQHRILDLFYQDSRPGPDSIWRINLIFGLKFLLPLALLSLAGYYLFTYTLPSIQHLVLKNLLKTSFAILFVFCAHQQLVISGSLQLAGTFIYRMACRTVGAIFGASGTRFIRNKDKRRQESILEV